LLGKLSGDKSIYVFFPSCPIEEKDLLFDQVFSANPKQLIELPPNTDLHFVIYSPKPSTENSNIIINLWDKQLNLKARDENCFIDMGSFENFNR
jgi:hypothetical protein